jgi:hypothetical protein
MPVRGKSASLKQVTKSEAFVELSRTVLAS